MRRHLIKLLMLQSASISTSFSRVHSAEGMQIAAAILCSWVCSIWVLNLQHSMTACSMRIYLAVIQSRRFESNQLMCLDLLKLNRLICAVFGKVYYANLAQVRKDDEEHTFEKVFERETGCKFDEASLSPESSPAKPKRARQVLYLSFLICHLRNWKKGIKVVQSPRCCPDMPSKKNIEPYVRVDHAHYLITNNVCFRRHVKVARITHHSCKRCCFKHNLRGGQGLFVRQIVSFQSRCFLIGCSDVIAQVLAVESFLLEQPVHVPAYWTITRQLTASSS